MEEKQVQKKGFLTTKEVAAKLGLSPQTIRMWRWDGTGPRYYRFHRSIFYKADDIEAWIRENYQPVEPEVSAVPAVGGK